MALAVWRVLIVERADASLQDRQHGILRLVFELRDLLVELRSQLMADQLQPVLRKLLPAESGRLAKAGDLYRRRRHEVRKLHCRRRRYRLSAVSESTAGAMNPW